MSKKKVLITGGAGFIGSHLVDAYIKSGYQVAVVDKKPQSYLQENHQEVVKYFQVDITDPEIEQVFKEFTPNIINHHAASIHVGESFQSPTDYSHNNVSGTIKLLELGKKYKIDQFIFASSVAVYGDVDKFPIEESAKADPQSFYGLDKHIAEQYIKLYSQYFHTTIFRYANVYGPRQTSSAEGGVVAIFAQNLASNKHITIDGDGNQTRDFIYVKDVAQSSIAVSQRSKSGTFHISTQQETSILELYKKTKEILSSELEPKHGPKRDGDIIKSVLSNQKMIKSFDWQPQYNLEKGLSETINWFAENK